MRISSDAVSDSDNESGILEVMRKRAEIVVECTTNIDAMEIAKKNLEVTNEKSNGYIKLKR